MVGTTMGDTVMSPFWREAFEKRRADLQSACPVAFQAATWDQFRENLNNRIVFRKMTSVQRWAVKCAPTLENVKSFSNTLNSFAQSQMIGNIVWGALQLLIEVR
jgi:hypothetical protein